MRVTVHLGEPFWRQIQSKEATLELPEGATVADMISSLEARYPELKDFLSQAELPPTVFLNDELAVPETPLTDNANPFMIWTLAGGSAGGMKYG